MKNIEYCKEVLDPEKKGLVDANGVYLHGWHSDLMEMEFEDRTNIFFWEKNYRFFERHELHQFQYRCQHRRRYKFPMKKNTNYLEEQDLTWPDLITQPREIRHMEKVTSSDSESSSSSTSKTETDQQSSSVYQEFQDQLI